MARLHDIVVDCSHPAGLARFWAAVLDDYEVAPYDEEELARLRVLGIDDPEDDPSVLVEGPEGTLRLWFQRVPEPKTSKNRTHLDLACEHHDVELARVVELGARVQAAQPNDSLVVMTDPEGNEFCLLKP